VYTDIIYDYTTDYSYDDFGQLISAVNNDNAIVNLDEMTYDPNCNITLKNEGGTPLSYTYTSGTNKVRNTDGAGDDYT